MDEDSDSPAESPHSFAGHVVHPDWAANYRSAPESQIKDGRSDNNLYMDSTISTDDTAEDLSKKKRILSNLTKEGHRGGQSLSASGSLGADRRVYQKKF